MIKNETPFQKLVNNHFLFRLYLLKNLPMAYIAGIAVNELTIERAVTTVKHRWLTQNPFHSMYFACLAMAAEMSTGLLLLNGVYKSYPAISMLIVKNQAVYHKKATGKIKFTCNDGINILNIVKKTKESTDSFLIDLNSTGMDETGDIVAEFIFTWSLKAKTKKV